MVWGMVSQLYLTGFTVLTPDYSPQRAGGCLEIVKKVCDCCGRWRKHIPNSIFTISEEVFFSLTPGFNHKRRK
jgi:hypothetical protein